MKHWSAQQLATLRRLREGFLGGSAGARDYWRSTEELALYDATFAQRIGWKWDAVLRELDARGWVPASRRVLDWGCGSGVAGRRVLAQWLQMEALTLHDRSNLAAAFANERARAEFPQIGVQVGEIATADTLVVLSHIINELADDDLSRLLGIISQAAEVIWVEAGTHADSRRLIAVRERLLASGEFAAVAPCTHQFVCGMLATRNARHWCHHFAGPPASVFQDARWGELSRELGIDLRSLPYSFLVLERRRADAPTQPGFSRVIGAPRDAKGYSKVLSCQGEGVDEFMLQKRDAPELLREVREGTAAPVYRWRFDGGKIIGGEPLEKRLPSAPPPA